MSRWQTRTSGWLAEVPALAGLVPEESYALLLAAGDVGPTTRELWCPEFEELVIGGAAITGQEFSSSNVMPGTYSLMAFAGFGLGSGESVSLGAALEEPVTVDAAEQVSVSLSLELPSALVVASITPAGRSAGVDLETDLAVPFTRPAFLREGDIAEEVGELSVSADGTTYTWPVTLAEETAYRVGVSHAEDEQGGPLVEPATARFTTRAEFLEGGVITGRLVLPELPAARVFQGRIFIGLIRAADVDIEDFRFQDVDAEDIAYSTITFASTFRIVDVMPGRYVAVVYTVVDLPRGFRPPDPHVALEASQPAAFLGRGNR